MNEFQEIIERNVVLSPDGRYRYRLSLSWSEAPRASWMLLNPSMTEPAEQDPTIQKCMEFTRQWGFGGIEVVSLYALRVDAPPQLLKDPDPIGPDYVKHLISAIKRSEVLIAAWGSENFLHRSAVLKKRPPHVLKSIRFMIGVGIPFDCLGASRSGNPYSPLTLPLDTPRETYDPSK